MNNPGERTHRKNSPLRGPCSVCGVATGSPCENLRKPGHAIQTPHWQRTIEAEFKGTRLESAFRELNEAAGQ